MSSEAHSAKRNPLYPNPNGELVCCENCGRDTRNKTAFCGRCLVTGVNVSDQLGRPSLPRADVPPEIYKSIKNPGDE